MLKIVLVLLFAFLSTATIRIITNKYSDKKKPVDRAYVFKMVLGFFISIIVLYFMEKF